MGSRFLCFLSSCILLFLVSCGGDETDCEHHQTTLVSLAGSLPNDAESPMIFSKRIATQGYAIQAPQVGVKNAVATRLSSAAFTLPVSNDFSVNPIQFDITLTGQSENPGSVSINLDSSTGAPSTVSTFSDLEILVDSINAQFMGRVDLIAEAVDLGGGEVSILVSQAQAGLSASIALSSLSENANHIGLSNSLVSNSGVPQVSNGYPSQEIVISEPNGNLLLVQTNAGDSAANIATSFDSLGGISADAQTTIQLTEFNSGNGGLRLNINGVDLAGTTLEEIELEINDSENSLTPDIVALYREGTASINVLEVVSQGGNDIEIAISSVDDGDSLKIKGDSNTAAVVLEVDTDGYYSGANASTHAVVVGGAVYLTLSQGYDIASVQDSSIFQPLNSMEYVSFVVNPIDPTIPGTYNTYSEVDIYDSLGAEHQLNVYFAKYPESNDAIFWKMYVQVNGNDIGESFFSADFPSGSQRAETQLIFNLDGTLDLSQNSAILISNWQPLNQEGIPSSALGPLNVEQGGALPIDIPPTSSNFEINVSGLTLGDEETLLLDSKASCR